MITLDNEVLSTVQTFMQNGDLFTALDVSNKVKMSLPLARHRDVRDAVRGLFSTTIEPAGWARSPITVTLTDGTTAEALLYHPLSDAWDLDNKYDAQKRSQGSVNTGLTGATGPTGAQGPTGVASVTVSANGNVSVSSPVSVNVTAPAILPAKDQWAALFNAQPSLFPRK
jgi:hypothetical protein